LSSIKGFATYFKERFKDRPAERDTATTMIQEVERLDRVIGQLLEFARPSSLKISPVDLRDLVHHSLRLIETDANTKGVRVQSHIAADLPPIPLDGDRMSQVLLNLYLNAIQAMKKGGVLEIGVTRNEDARQTSITVSDTGPGMTADEQERIFDPYFTTKSTGTGLGLAIVHKIMEAHGGDVVVKSVPGQGTTVVLVLPDHKELPRDGRDGH
jgi:two-component system sensor histidine kinase HydH